VEPVVVVALLGAVGVGVTALGTYLVARRQASGDVGTSDAATLWKESQEMRRELRDEVIRLRADVTRLELEIHRQSQEIRKLRERLEHKS
jgi:hypothetical protein